MDSQAVGYTQASYNFPKPPLRAGSFTRKNAHGELVHPKFNQFCKWVNGYVDGEDTDPTKHNYFSIRDLTKSAWFMYLPLQAIGLINKKAAQFAKAWYGVCWSIVYSCYRPWKANSEKLAEVNKDGNPIKAKNLVKNLYNFNEYFRMIMGSVVSAVYGSGAFGMLFGAITDNEDLFDRSSDIYQTGMFNQNQIFASMNTAICLRRAVNPDQLDDVDKRVDNEAENSRSIKSIKENIEWIDSLLFLPNILTRGLDTLKLFGMNVMSEGAEKLVNSLGYFSYGTWAAKFGIMKTREEKGGDLASIKDSNDTLYQLQKIGGKAFYSVLPVLSWTSACAELFGLRDFAQKTFKLEGILERLNPTIFAWCLTNPWLQGYIKAVNPAMLNNRSLSEV